MKIDLIKQYNFCPIANLNTNNNSFAELKRYPSINLHSYNNIISFTSNIKNLGLPAKNYNLDNKTILITGATGTLGNALIKELLQNYKPKQIVVFSRDEYKQYKMKQNLPKNVPIKFIIGDIRDEARVNNILKNVDVVIHTAAMKHVSICEENKDEALKTNFFGTLNLVSAVHLANA